MSGNEKLRKLKKQIVLINKFRDAIKKNKVFLETYKFTLNDNEKNIISEAIDIIDKQTKNIEQEALSIDNN